jgi:hypothetical protein
MSGLTTHVARSLDDIAYEHALAQEAEWEHARQFLLAAVDDPFADHLLWLSDGTQPVASVQVFLHRYAIGAAQVGMCLPEWPFVPPDLRGRGYFKEIMSRLISWMPGAGYPLAYDHGRKGLYTGIGFAPCFHHGLLLIRTVDALRLPGRNGLHRPSSDQVARHALQLRSQHPLARGLTCRDESWVPDSGDVRFTGDADGDGPTGIAVIGGGFLAPKVAEATDASGGASATHGPGILTVTDAWASDARTAAQLLRGLATEARQLGCEWLRINCRPTDTLARVGVLAGGEMRSCAAQERDHTKGGEDVDAFYLAGLAVAVEQLLPELNHRWQQSGVAGATALGLRVDDEEVWIALAGDVRILASPQSSGQVVELPRKAMTQAIMGYATPSELSLIHDACRIPARAATTMDVLFPATSPHIIHEEYAFARADHFGLVP